MPWHSLDSNYRVYWFLPFEKIEMPGLKWLRDMPRHKTGCSPSEQILSVSGRHVASLAYSGQITRDSHCTCSLHKPGNPQCKQPNNCSVPPTSRQVTEPDPASETIYVLGFEKYFVSNFQK
jgi:hypothetical protein